MKYKKDLAGLFVLLGLTWQVFDTIRFSHTPTQAILVVIFAYLGFRLTYFVYFKNKQLSQKLHKSDPHFTEKLFNYSQKKLKKFMKKLRRLLANFKYKMKNFRC